MPFISSGGFLEPAGEEVAEAAGSGFGSIRVYCSVPSPSPAPAYIFAQDTPTIGVPMTA